MTVVDNYHFHEWVPMNGVGQTLVFALMAVQDIYGPDRVESGLWRCCDEKAREVWIDPSTEAGSACSRLFAGLIRREFGETAFTHSRVSGGKEVA